MRKTLIIGGIPVELEANLGTSALFQEFTGKNILEMSSMITDGSRGLRDINLNLSAPSEELIKNKEFVNNVGVLSNTLSQMIDVAQKLAYVMNVQAKHGKTKEDISKMRQELNADSLLAWSFQFDPKAFTAQTYRELMEFWKIQSERTSTPKNA